ncbi:MAG: endo alpha-1,4 polygalactosaminidase, partial [Candidatus Dormibacteraeota bacterium]|nr:endo alpha-1,4 polygalactosaminidase [Candidatus Dormibacteraeota bacterium]
MASLYPRRRILVVLPLILVPLFAFAGAGSPTRAVAAAPGGAVLDGWGGVHPFGGYTINTNGGPYWPGWDIARSLVTLPDGSGGWELDGWGGVHAFGSAPAVTDEAYWPGWDIARGLVVLPNHTSGYTLDGWGGVHPFGGAPSLGGAPFWAGWDIARGLDIHYDSSGHPDGGWTLDAYGGIHSFGAAPPLATPQYFPGVYAFRGLHVTGDGTGAYMVAADGSLVRAESAPALDMSSFPSWGGWEIVRDIVPGTSGGTNPSPNPTSSPTPTSTGTPTPTPTPTSTPTPSPSGSRWIPSTAPTGWQWEIGHPLSTSSSTDMGTGLASFVGGPAINPTVYDIDGFDNPASTVAALHALGDHVVCFIEAGAAENYRSD